MEDCYYFLYSNCSRPNCEFRHSESAKGNPILCRNWKSKKPCKVECEYRHSTYHLNKKRHEILCYWEKTTGCTKPKCEYRHTDLEKDKWKEKIYTNGKDKILENKQINSNDKNNSNETNNYEINQYKNETKSCEIKKFEFVNGKTRNIDYKEDENNAQHGNQNLNSHIMDSNTPVKHKNTGFEQFKFENRNEKNPLESNINESNYFKTFDISKFSLNQNENTSFNIGNDGKYKLSNDNTNNIDISDKQIGEMDIIDYEQKPKNDEFGFGDYNANNFLSRKNSEKDINSFTKNVVCVDELEFKTDDYDQNRIDDYKKMNTNDFGNRNMENIEQPFTNKFKSQTEKQNINACMKNDINFKDKYDMHKNDNFFNNIKGENNNSEKVEEIDSTNEKPNEIVEKIFVEDNEKNIVIDKKDIKSDIRHSEAHHPIITNSQNTSLITNSSILNTQIFEIDDEGLEIESDLVIKQLKVGKRKIDDIKIKKRPKWKEKIEMLEKSLKNKKKLICSIKNVFEEDINKD